MTLREEVLQVIEQIPEQKLPSLIDFARYLKSSYEAEHNEAKAAAERKPRRHGGWIKGEVWMSDDFNDPMEFVSEDEMRVLEIMRASKKKQTHQLQEAVI